MSYRLLTLPHFPILSLAAIRKIRDLVEAGAVVLGPKPQRTASLMEYPASETELKSIADALWDGKRVESTVDAKEALRRRGILPDLEIAGQTGMDWIHRRDGEADIYFVSSQNPKPVSVSCTFRVAGKQPELWDAVSGRRRNATAFTQEGGRTRLPLEFAPYGSQFIIFRTAIASTAAGTTTSNHPRHQPLATVNGPWEVTFAKDRGGPGTVRFEQLQDWIKHNDAGIRAYSGSAVYRATFDKPAGSGRIALDLGEVLNIAEVRVNGTLLGVLWAPPFRVELPDDLRASGNELDITVVNTWFNRLVADRDLPPAKRLTKSNVELKPNAKPCPSGLIGPVTMLAVEPPR
jgi:hypothetical protein